MGGPGEREESRSQAGPMKKAATMRYGRRFAQGCVSCRRTKSVTPQASPLVFRRRAFQASPPATSDQARTVAGSGMVCSLSPVTWVQPR